MISNNQMIHMACETVALCGVTYFLNNKINTLQKEVEELKSIVTKQKEQMDKGFSSVFSMMDEILSSQNNFQPQTQPQVDAGIRKRRVHVPQPSPQPVKQSAQQSAQQPVQQVRQPPPQTVLNSIENVLDNMIDGVSTIFIKQQQTKVESPNITIMDEEQNDESRDELEEEMRILNGEENWEPQDMSSDETSQTIEDELPPLVEHTSLEETQNIETKQQFEEEDIEILEIPKKKKNKKKST